MTIDSVSELLRTALLQALVIAGPVLVVAAVTGLVVSLFQAVTQIQDQTISLISKIIVTTLTVVLLLPWMLSRMVTWSTDLYLAIPDSFH